MQNKKAAAFPLSVQPIPSFRKADLERTSQGCQQQKPQGCLQQLLCTQLPSVALCLPFPFVPAASLGGQTHFSCLELKPGVAPGSCSHFCQSVSSPSGERDGYKHLRLQRGCWPFSDRRKQAEVLLFQCDHYPNTLSLKARQTTAFWCPLYSLLISPVSTHHSLARLSEEAGTE